MPILDKLNNTILQQLRVKLNPEQLRANDLATMMGASSRVINIAFRVRELRSKQKEILQCAQPYVPLDAEISTIYMSLWQEIRS